MYRSFFGLRERPFDLTPNPRYLYLTGRHREALSTLQYGITGRKGITVLIGDAGTGKTTIVRAAIDALAGSAVECVCVSNPALTRDEFYEYLAPRFGLGELAGQSKAQFLSQLEDHLMARRQVGGTTALIVDEAQSLPHELMEEVRLLANLETAEEKLLQVVLAGQPELAERLEHEALRQLKQRVALRCDLLPLDIRETAAYISGRIAIAGGQAARIFTREAIQAIHHYSRGIPRTISVLCDNAMVTAFAAGTSPIGAGIIHEVSRDFRLSLPASQAVEESGSRRIVAALPTSAPDLRQPASGVNSASREHPVRTGSQADSGTSESERAVAVGETDRGPSGPMFGMFTKKKRFRFF